MKTHLELMYKKNFDKLVKKISFRAGGLTNGEDVVQEAFARALQYMDSFDPNRKPLEAWFNTILNNACRDFKRETMMDGMAREPLTATLDNSMFQDEMIQVVEKEINSRNPREAEALWLFLVLGYTVKEVVAVTEYTSNTVSVLVCNFRKMMRESYGESVCC